MSRGTPTDAHRRRIEARVPGKAGDRGAAGQDDRRFGAAVPWLVRAGAPWRDLPAEFGAWNTARRRFSRRARAGVWRRPFEALADDPDFEHVILLDATIVRAHRHSAGAQRGGLRLGPSAAPAAA